MSALTTEEKKAALDAALAAYDAAAAAYDTAYTAAADAVREPVARDPYDAARDLDAARDAYDAAFLAADRAYTAARVYARARDEAAKKAKD